MESLHNSEFAASFSLKVLTDEQRAVLGALKTITHTCPPETQTRIKLQLQTLTQQINDLTAILQTQKSLTLKLALRQRSNSITLSDSDPTKGTAAVGEAAPEANNLSEDVEDTLRGVFAISDLSYKDEMHALAHQLGCTEEQVRDFFTKMKSNVRSLMQRLQKKSQTPTDVGGEGVLEDSGELAHQNSIGAAPPDSLTHMEKLKRLLDENGGISHAHSTGALIMQMQQAASYAVKSAQLQAILNTQNANVLLRLVTSKLLDTMNLWLLAAYDDKQNTFLKLLLKTLQHLPIALPVLKDTELSNSVGILCKHYRESIAEPAKELMQQWQHQEGGHGDHDKIPKFGQPVALGTSKVAMLQKVGSKTRSTGIHINRGRPLSTDDIKRAKLKAARQRNAAQAELPEGLQGPSKDRKLEVPAMVAAASMDLGAHTSGSLPSRSNSLTPSNSLSAALPDSHHTPPAAPRNIPNPAPAVLSTSPNVITPSSIEATPRGGSNNHHTTSPSSTPASASERELKRAASLSSPSRPIREGAHSTVSTPPAPKQNTTSSSKGLERGSSRELRERQSPLAPRPPPKQQPTHVDDLPHHEPDWDRLSMLQEVNFDEPFDPKPDPVPGVVIRPLPLTCPMDHEKRVHLASVQNPALGSALRAFYNKAAELKPLQQLRIQQRIDSVVRAGQNLAGMKSNVRWPMHGLLRLEGGENIPYGIESVERQEIQTKISSQPRRAPYTLHEPQEPHESALQEHKMVKQLLFTPAERKEVEEHNKKMWNAGVRIPGYVTIPNAPPPPARPSQPPQQPAQVVVPILTRSIMINQPQAASIPSIPNLVSPALSTHGPTPPIQAQPNIPVTLQQIQQASQPSQQVMQQPQQLPPPPPPLQPHQHQQQTANGQQQQAQAVQVQTSTAPSAPAQTAAGPADNKSSDNDAASRALKLLQALKGLASAANINKGNGQSVAQVIAAGLAQAQSQAKPQIVQSQQMAQQVSQQVSTQQVVQQPQQMTQQVMQQSQQMTQQVMQQPQQMTQQVMQQSQQITQQVVQQPQQMTQQVVQQPQQMTQQVVQQSQQMTQQLQQMLQNSSNQQSIMVQHTQQLPGTFQLLQQQAAVPLTQQQQAAIPQQQQPTVLLTQPAAQQHLPQQPVTQVPFQQQLYQHQPALQAQPTPNIQIMQHGQHAAGLGGMPPPPPRSGGMYPPQQQFQQQQLNLPGFPPPPHPAGSQGAHGLPPPQQFPPQVMPGQLVQMQQAQGGMRGYGMMLSQGSQLGMQVQQPPGPPHMPQGAYYSWG